jgi:hypothetical protein
MGRNRETPADPVTAAEKSRTIAHGTAQASRFRAPEALAAHPDASFRPCYRDTSRIIGDGGLGLKFLCAFAVML